MLIPGPPILYAPVRLSLLNIKPFALLVFNVPREALKVNTESRPIFIGSCDVSILLKFNLVFLSNIALTVESSVACVSTCAI